MGGGPATASRPAKMKVTFMKLSARNQLKGRIVEIRKGATTAHVRIDIGDHIAKVPLLGATCRLFRPVIFNRFAIGFGQLAKAGCCFQ